MDSKDYSPPLRKYTVYDVQVHNRVEDSLAAKMSINPANYTFYLMCKKRISNQANVIMNLKEKDRVGLMVLFEKRNEIHYKETAILFYYKPYDRLIKVNLTH